MPVRLGLGGHSAPANFKEPVCKLGRLLRRGILVLGEAVQAEMKAKAEIVRFSKESFAFGHKAVATLTPVNSVETVGKNKRTRLFPATFALLHRDSSRLREN